MNYNNIFLFLKMSSLDLEKREALYQIKKRVLQRYKAC